MKSLGSKLFILANVDLYTYDKEIPAYELIQNPFRFSDTEISYMLTSQPINHWSFIYSNANIDLLVNEEDIYNLPDYKTRI